MRQAFYPVHLHQRRFSNLLCRLNAVKVRSSNSSVRACRGFKNAYSVFSEEELRELTEDLQGLKAAETSFEFWDNEANAVYDNLLPAATFPLFTDWWMANSKFARIRRLRVVAMMRA